MNPNNDKRMEKKRRWIGVLGLAEKLGCHPASVPRFVKSKPGFPQPVKPFGKNMWDEDVIDAYVESLASAASRAMPRRKHERENIGPVP
jgi:hypothetical protein